MTGVLGSVALAVGLTALIVGLFLPSARPSAPEGGAVPCLPTLPTLAGKKMPSEGGTFP